MKVGSGIGTAALGWVLAAGNFDASAATQLPASLNAINWSFAWIPTIMTVLAVLCMVFFDLDKQYDKIVEDLAAGRHKSDSDK